MSAPLLPLAPHAVTTALSTLPSERLILIGADGDPSAGLGTLHPLVRRLAEPDQGGRLFETFLDGYRLTTATLYRQRLDAYAAFVGVAPAALAARFVAQGPASMTQTLREFAANLRRRVVVTRSGNARTLSAATRNGYLDAVAAFATFLRKGALIAWDVSIDREKVEAYRDTAGPGVEAIGRVLAWAARARDPRVAARDVALVSLYADWGLRASEPLGAGLGDVVRDEDGRPNAIWILGKGRTQKSRLTLPPPTADALEAWLAVRRTLPDCVHDEGLALPGDLRPLFVSLDPAIGQRRASITHQPPVQRLSRRALGYLIGRLGRRAGIARLTPHMLRHTAITAVLDAGASIRDAQRFSRHLDPRVLLRYDDNRQDLGGRLAAELSARYRATARTQEPVRPPGAADPAVPADGSRL